MGRYKRMRNCCLFALTLAVLLPSAALRTEADLVSEAVARFATDDLLQTTLLVPKEVVTQKDEALLDGCDSGLLWVQAQLERLEGRGSQQEQSLVGGHPDVFRLVDVALRLAGS